MSTNVTSIARARAAARTRTDRMAANSRLSVTYLVVVVTLIIIGLGATWSASSVPALNAWGDRLALIKRQVLWVGFGAVAMWVTARLPYQWYRRFAWPIFGVGVAALLAVLITGITLNGSTRWLAIGDQQLQPSEFMKFAVIINLAAVMARKEKVLNDYRHFLVPVAVIVGLPAMLIMLQPDLGTTLIVSAAAMAVLVASASPLRYVLATGTIGTLAATALAFGATYRRERLLYFLDPWSDPQGPGYQLIQSYLALGTGGVGGVGLGASRARWSFLPNAHSDFIFAIIGEETGFIGASAVLILLAVLCVLGVVIAMRAPDRFGRMVAAGLTGWIGAQALVNLGGVLGVLPITGLALPFVSLGGSALLAAMGAAGVLISIARRGVNST